MPLTRKSMLDLFASSKFSRLTQGALSAFAPEGSRAHESREKRDNRGSGLLVIVTFIVYHSMTYWQLWQFSWQFGGQFQHALLTCARCLASAQVILPYFVWDSGQGAAPGLQRSCRDPAIRRGVASPRECCCCPASWPLRVFTLGSLAPEGGLLLSSSCHVCHVPNSAKLYHSARMIQILKYY